MPAHKQANSTAGRRDIQLPRRLATVVLVATALTLSACSSAVPAAVAPTLAPTALPTQAPTATPGPDVAALLATRMAAVTSGEQHLAGTFRAGDVQATFEGSQSNNGPDSSSSLSTTFAGSVVTEQRVKVAGTRYVKRGQGPWLVDSADAGSSDTSTALKDALKSATDLDASAADAALHHLESKIQGFNPVAFGFAAEGQAAGGTAKYTFVAKPDGTPVSVRIEAAWKQASGESTVDATLDLTIEFRKLDNRPRIAPPADVWAVHESTEAHYSIAYPADFDRSRDENTDYFFGPDAKHMAYVMRVKLPSRATLNLAATEELTNLKKLFSAKAGTNEAVTIDGANGRLLSVSGTNKEFEGKAIAQEALVIKGKYIYLIGYLAPTGNEGVDRAMFNALISTFRVT